ncbi:Conserved_hypothetical protein [Hexamita inflata]|uniref:Uncharacterized protein n=1 Tax=Hexamita inflata TaxID=28002 RepID=A0ABP1GK72_9EUKA
MDTLTRLALLHLKIPELDLNPVDDQVLRLKAKSEAQFNELKKQDETRINNILYQVENEIENIKRNRVTQAEFEVFNQSPALIPYLQQSQSKGSPFVYIDRSIRDASQTTSKIIKTQQKYVENEMQFLSHLDDLKKKQKQHSDTHLKQLNETIQEQKMKLFEKEKKHRELLQQKNEENQVQTQQKEQKMKEKILKVEEIQSQLDQQRNLLSKRINETYKQKLETVTEKRIRLEEERKADLLRSKTISSPLKKSYNFNVEEKIKKANEVQDQLFEQKLAQKKLDLDRRKGHIKQREIRLAEVNPDELEQKKLKQQRVKAAEAHMQKINEEAANKMGTASEKVELAWRKAAELKQKRKEEIILQSKLKEIQMETARKRKQQLEEMNEMERMQQRLVIEKQAEKIDQLLEFKREKENRNRNFQIFASAIDDKEILNKFIAETQKTAPMIKGIGKDMGSNLLKLVKE